MLFSITNTPKQLRSQLKLLICGPFYNKWIQSFPINYFRYPLIFSDPRWWYACGANYYLQNSNFNLENVWDYWKSNPLLCWTMGFKRRCERLLLVLMGFYYYEVTDKWQLVDSLSVNFVRMLMFTYVCRLLSIAVQNHQLTKNPIFYFGHLYCLSVYYLGLMKC